MLGPPLVSLLRLPSFPSEHGKVRPVVGGGRLLPDAGVTAPAPDAPHELGTLGNDSDLRIGVCGWRLGQDVCSPASAASTPAVLSSPLAARYSWIICRANIQIGESDNEFGEHHLGHRCTRILGPTLEVRQLDEADGVARLRKTTGRIIVLEVIRSKHGAVQSNTFLVTPKCQI